MSDYSKLTKKELLYTLLTRDSMLKERRKDTILLEKALELACEECLSFPCSDYCSSNDDCEDCYYKREFTTENFKTKAQEMMKSEFR